MTKKKMKKKPNKGKSDNPLLESVLATLHGDLTTAIADEVRTAEDTWQKLPESKQKQVLDRINRKAENMIRQMFTLTAKRGFEHATAVVKQVAFKDLAKISMESPKNDGAHELADRINQSVIILFVDPEEYLNGGSMPEPEKDQKEIDVD